VLGTQCLDTIQPFLLAEVKVIHPVLDYVVSCLRNHGSHHVRSTRYVSRIFRGRDWGRMSKILPVDGNRIRNNVDTPWRI